MEFQLDTLENGESPPPWWGEAGEAEADEAENKASLSLSACALG